ncbi:MAG: tRNA (guanosine(37)-N1)-methyltransferase TrmD [Candidatus Omnitrophica bacterium]|nr:tRNA (guanosine(37)-N1)-methyltransferase TrmD [Candidatus Omnitrophota bacterium]
MLIDVLTIFPASFPAVLNESILKRAQRAGKVKIRINDIRDYTEDKHKKVDDRPFGGGPGMVMCPQPIFSAVEAICKKNKVRKDKRKIILLSPQGRKLTQERAKQLSKFKHLVLICGHYEGVDERVKGYLVDEEISIGDYVLTGGELPAMVLIDSVVRLLPGVLGRSESLKEESFESGILEYPQYTRPADFRKMKVPALLLSGDHKAIADWRRKQALLETKKKRADLLKQK